MPRRLGTVVFRGILAGLAACAFVGRTTADDETIPTPDDSLKTLRVAPGFQVELFASEPLLANPVAFHVDEKGRFFVVETFRHTDGVPDARGHMYWLKEDLAAETVADRVAMYKRHFSPEEFDRYKVESERIRLVEDRDGDGRADHASVFAEGFDLPEDGVAAGVLTRKGNVYFTSIPDLWLFQEVDGKAKSRKLLHNGYGVHVAFLGHDLHGLTFGPDGRLYFSIGDRGFNVKTLEGGVLAELASGSVLRCEPDGTKLEIVATGLRNPQELAFNETGDLFTVDNNSDGGDKARFVHIVDGGDNGWRIGYQFVEYPNSRGVWNSERMWTPDLDGKPASMIPPLANISDGPSGLTYYPGVGLNDSEKGRFYLCDFRGAPATSGVRSFTTKPRGASFDLVDPRQFLWGLQATDCDFAPDGSLYVTDWIQGWQKTGKGRIWRVSDPNAKNDPRVAEVKRLIAEGFDSRSNDELGGLLAYPDRRIRQESQFTLADRARTATEPNDALAVLQRVAESPSEDYARLHAVWGIGQVLRVSNEAKASELIPPLVELLKDENAEVRAQTARALSESLVASPTSILPLLEDDSPRVRLYAMLALARLAPSAEVMTPIAARLRAGDGRDPYLRHAAVMALARSADVERLEPLATDSSADVRMASLLVLRRWNRPEVARFLDDPDPSLVLEAARCITERPNMETVLAKLASLSGRTGISEQLWRRVLVACELLDPRSTAEVAARIDAPEAIRVEALQILARWAEPPALHPITGLWRGEMTRSVDGAVTALAPLLPKLVADTSDAVRNAAAAAAGGLKIADAGPSLRTLVADVSRPADSRVEALRALDALRDQQLAEVVALARSDQSDSVRAEGLRILARLEPDRAVEEAAEVLERGTILEKQSAFAMLGAASSSKADPLLANWLDKLPKGGVAPELRLDLTEAAARREAKVVKAALRLYTAGQVADDPLGAYRDVLVGGNADRGRKIFREKAEVQCLRCHKIAGDGGEVGPELAGIGARKDRDYLLEAIVLPSKQIAEGFETQLLALENGQVVAGIVRSEDEREVRLINAEGESIVVSKDDIEEKTRGASAMPDDIIQKLDKTELRDLVEFLATLPAVDVP